MRAYHVEQLEAEAAAVEPRLAAMKDELDQFGLQMAERQRAIDDSPWKAGVPNGDRTRVPALKGLCPDR